MKQLVKVEPKHIEKGIRGNALSCPLAVAIKEATQLKAVWVGNMHTDWKHTLGYTDIEQIDITIPAIEYDLVMNYDCTGEMEPHEFEIEYPKAINNVLTVTKYYVWYQEESNRYVRYGVRWELTADIEEAMEFRDINLANSFYENEIKYAINEKLIPLSITKETIYKRYK